MIFFELLQKNCANFPILTADELNALKLELPILISKAKRSCQIPQGQKTTQEQELSFLLPTFEQLLQFKLNSPSIHLVALLLEDEFNLTPHLLFSNSMIWKNIFKHFIFLDELSVNLQFIKNYDSIFLHPSQFSGLISALLEYGYNKEIIIQSGIMQKFFKFHVSSIEILEDTYTTLEKHQDNPLIQDFLMLANQTDCGMAVFAKTNILGKELIVSDEVEQQVIIQAQNDLILSKEQFTHLFSWLKSDFLVLFLALNTHHSEHYLSLLTPWFAEQSFSEIKALYQNIFYILPEYISFQVFKAIGKFLPTPTIKQLITTPSKWFWIGLATTTKGAVPVPKKQILTLAMQHPIENKDIAYIHELCHKPQFKPLYEHFYHNIFELFAKSPDLELDDSIFHSLKLYPKTKYWTMQLAQQLKNTLLQTIESNLSDFDHDKFINIRDVFLSQTSVYKKIKLFNFEMDAYPEGHYHLTSLVLSNLYMSSENIDAYEWAKQMLPGRLQFEESKTEAQSLVKRILKEWIINSPSYEIILYACVVLNKHFQVSISHLENILPTSRSLTQFALYNKACLEYYLQLFPDDSLANIMTYSSQADNEPIIIKMLAYPKVLLNFLKKLNQTDCYQILNFKYKHQPALFIQLFNQPKILRHCLSLINEEQRKSLFQIINPSDESNIYYISVKSPKTLNLLLTYTDYQDFVQGIQTSTLIHDSAFEHAFNNPESFSLLINRLETQDLLQICQSCSKQTSELYLESILKQTELLQILLEKLPAQSIHDLLIQNLDSLINTSIHKPELWHMILSRLPSELSFSLLASPIGPQTLMHCISKYPESMEAVLMQMPANLRLHLLKLENLRQQSVVASLNKPIYPSLSIIIELLPAQDLIEFSQLPFHPPRIILDLLVSQINLFHKFYLFLPHEQQQALLLHVTANQERVIDQISLNETTLIKEIFSSLPSEAVYQIISSNHANLLTKSLHHPQILEYFLEFIDKIELLELMFGHQENYCPALFKITQTQSVLTLIQSALSIDHQSILMHKHQHAGSILQFCINEPNDFLSVLAQSSMDTLDCISQKICAHSLSLKPLLEKPSLFAKMIQFLPEPKRKACLDAICFQYPQFNLSLKLKSVLTELLYPKSKSLSFFQSKQNNPSIHPKLKPCNVLLDILDLSLSSKKQSEPMASMKL